MSALFINAAILIVAAAVFHGTGTQQVADISDAYQLLSPLLGAGGEHALRRGAALLRAERHAHGHAGRPDRDGGLRQHPAAALAAAADHAAIAIVPAIIVIASTASRARVTAHPQPGDPEPAAVVRGVSARQLHRQPAEDGPVRAPAGCGCLPGRSRLSLRRSTSGCCSRPSWAEPFTRPCIAASSSPSRTRRPTTPSWRTCGSWPTLTGAEMLLVHVADGWAARHFNDLQLRESEEMQADRAYLAELRRAACRDFRSRPSWRWATPPTN